MISATRRKLQGGLGQEGCLNDSRGVRLRLVSGENEEKGQQRIHVSDGSLAGARRGRGERVRRCGGMRGERQRRPKDVRAVVSEPASSWQAGRQARLAAEPRRELEVR